MVNGHFFYTNNVTSVTNQFASGLTCVQDVVPEPQCKRPLHVQRNHKHPKPSRVFHHSSLVSRHGPLGRRDIIPGASPTRLMSVV